LVKILIFTKLSFSKFRTLNKIKKPSIFKMSDNGSVNGEEIENIPSQLSDNLELLQEKRSSTREKAMNFFIKQFRTQFLEDFIESNRTTLLEHLKKSLKRGNENELVLAPKVLSLMSITLGTSSENLYKEIAPIYKEMINNGFSSDQAFSAFLDSLGIICFIGNNDEHETVDVMDLFKKTFSSNHKSPLTLSSALRNWGLLLTTEDKSFAYDTLIPDILESLVLNLNSNFVEVRVAAGEVLALVIEISKLANEAFSLKKFSNRINIDDLKDILSEYTFDKNRQQSKKDKDKQRNIFKQISSYVLDDEQPEEILSFKHQKFSFDTWASIHQLNRLRDCLGEGLHIHFVENDIIHDIFNIQVDKDAKKTQLSQVEKRMYLSPNSEASKHQSKQRSKQRDIKNSFSNSNNY